MNKKVLFAIIFAVILVGASAWRIQRAFDRIQSYIPNTHQTRVLMLNGHKIEAEIVSSSEDIKQGLSDRESMAQDKGMLFELPVRAIHAFWMNRMHFPLDIIWIDGDVVVEIAERLPPPKFAEIPASHTPKADADKVLEVNAGVVKATGLKVGDEVGGLY